MGLIPTQVLGFFCFFFLGKRSRDLHTSATANNSCYRSYGLHYYVHLPDHPTSLGFETVFNEGQCKAVYFDKRGM